MSGESLVGLLDQMFAASVQHQGQVHRKLASGLHVKVGVRGDKRMIILWRDGDRLPSAKECEIVGEDAGFFDPKYRTWQCKESESAFLVTEGYQGEPCEHAWGFRVVVDSNKVTGHYQTCLKCGIKAQVLTPRRGKKQRFGYGSCASPFLSAGWCVARWGITSANSPTTKMTPAQRRRSSKCRRLPHQHRSARRRPNNSRMKRRKPNWLAC